MKKVLFLLPLFLFSCGGEEIIRSSPVFFPDFTVGVRNQAVDCRVEKGKRSIPDWVKEEVKLSMKEPLPFSSVIYALSKGNVVIDKEADKEVRIPHFEGSIGELLNSYCESQGFCLEYRGNTAVIKKECVRSLKVPDWIDKEAVSSFLKMKGISYSFEGKNHILLLRGRRDIVETVERELSSFFSYKINVRIFVGELSQKRNREKGINWERVIGQYYSSVGEGVKSSAKFSIENGVSLFELKTPHFSLEGLIGVLSRYANVRVLQNVSSAVGNGMKVEVVAGEKTPYVKEIGATVIGQNTTTQTVQTVTFGEVNSGIKVEAVPFYDEEKGIVRLKLKVEDTAVTGYVNLKSGEYEVTRPTVSEKKMETVLSFSPDEVIVLTNLGRDYEGTRGNSISGLFPFKKVEKENRELFIVLGVEVVRYDCKG